MRLSASAKALDRRHFGTTVFERVRIHSPHLALRSVGSWGTSPCSRLPAASTRGPDHDSKHASAVFEHAGHGPHARALRVHDQQGTGRNTLVDLPYASHSVQACSRGVARPARAPRKLDMQGAGWQVVLTLLDSCLRRGHSTRMPRTRGDVVVARSRTWSASTCARPR